MEIVFPQTLQQGLLVAVPLVTILIGACYFLMPGRMLAMAGLAPRAEYPDAVGEGRSSFAGFALGTGACALIFGQPNLLTLLGLSYAAASVGRLLHIVVDGAGRRLVLARLTGSAGLAVLALWQGGLPDLSFAPPASHGEWLMATAAALTAFLGAVGLLAPGLAMARLRLCEVSGKPEARGELRGLMAGLYLATGTMVLGAGGIFVQLALGTGWLVTACGRMVSMLSDRANNLFNWLSLLFELLLAALPLALVFGVMR